jgi:hypothetical protein
MHAKRVPANDDDKQWEDPINPEGPGDARDEEQIKRQATEAKRRKDNLTETDHIDKPILKTNNK